MTTKFELTGLEAQAYLFRERVREMENDDSNNWSTTELCLADAFVANWSKENTSNGWVNIAMALNGINPDEKCIRRAFRNLLKAKLIYSRRRSGKQHYGIDFNSPAIV